MSKRSISSAARSRGRARTPARLGERDVLGDGHLGDQSVARAILGDVRDAAAQRVAQVRGELGLAVAGDADDGDDLAGMHFEACHVGDAGGRGAKLPSAASAGAPSACERFHHRLGQLLRAHRAAVDDDPSAPHDHDPRGHFQHLGDFVADEDDGDAVRGQPPHDVEQLARLGGREDGGRLVEDQKSRMAGDRFDQLQLRFLADGEIGDAAVDAAKVDAGVADDLRRDRGPTSPARGSRRW